MRSTATVPVFTATTFRRIGTFCDNLPDVAVTVTVAISACAELPAFSVSVLVPEAFGELKVAVTPAGSPVAARLTLLWNPFLGVTPTTTVALRPCVMERLVVELESRKSLSPAAAGGRTSYRGCAGFMLGLSSATVIARIRILGLSGSLMLLPPGSKATA